MNRKKAFEILQITWSPELTLEMVKKQKKKLERLYHPDNGGDEDKFHEIEEAFSYLKIHGLEEVERTNTNAEAFDYEGSDLSICQCCHGTGKINKKVQTSRGARFTKVTCDICRGTGKIKRG